MSRRKIIARTLQRRLQLICDKTREEAVERITDQVRGGPREKKVAAAAASTSAEVPAADGHNAVVSFRTGGQRHKVKQSRCVIKFKTSTKSFESQTTSEPKTLKASKNSNPKKLSADGDGTRPKWVYELIGKVQGKQVDEDGNIILWDTVPTVKVNQHQLIKVIFRSYNTFTLTRRLTTIVFGTHKILKRPGEPLAPAVLQAVVEFILHSGFDFEREYDKKRIFLIMGYRLNELRAETKKSKPLVRLTPVTLESSSSINGRASQPLDLV